MGALTDILKSERGIVALALIICATVLAAMGLIEFSDWRDYTLYIFGIYATSKTATGVAQIIKSKPASEAPTTASGEITTEK